MKERPTFCKIVEMLVPDLNPSFRDVSFFFSEENMGDYAGNQDSDFEGEGHHQDGPDDYTTPLTDSRPSLSLSGIDGGTPYRSNISLNNSRAHLSDGEDCLCVDIEPDKIKKNYPDLVGASAVELTPLRGAPSERSEPEHKDSRYNEPPRKPSSNEGSKESSKSSGSSIFHLNGYSNGHILRANNMPRQGNAEC